MKNFLSLLFMWIVVMLVGTFFFGAFLFGSQNIYYIVIVLAVVFATISNAFIKQSDRIAALEKRVKELEDKD